MGRLTTVIFLLVLAMTTEMGTMVGEARMCETQSHHFKGACLSDTNCKSVCHTEGYSGGECKGFRRRCFCTTHC